LLQPKEQEDRLHPHRRQDATKDTTGAGELLSGNADLPRRVSVDYGCRSWPHAHGCFNVRRLQYRQARQLLRSFRRHSFVHHRVIFSELYWNPGVWRNPICDTRCSTHHNSLALGVWLVRCTGSSSSGGSRSSHRSEKLHHGLLLDRQQYTRRSDLVPSFARAIFWRTRSNT